MLSLEPGQKCYNFLGLSAGRIHWSYGDSELDQKAASTCCTRKGRLVAPFRALPQVSIRAMVEQEHGPRFKTPSSSIIILTFAESCPTSNKKSLSQFLSETLDVRCFGI